MKNNTLKILLICLFILGNSGKILSQESKSNKEVEGMVQSMFDNMNNKDFDALVDMTHPKVFDIVPKDQMKTLFKNMFEGNEEFLIEIPKGTPDYTISEVFEGIENNLEYAYVSYDTKMSMTFKNQEFDDESKEMMIPLMEAQGMEVEFISNNTMKVLIKNTVTIILKEDSTDNKWVMINYDPDSPLSYSILSSDVLEKSKEYKRNLMLERKKNSED